jgi:hypothetical protein
MFFAFLCCLLLLLLASWGFGVLLGFLAFHLCKDDSIFGFHHALLSFLVVFST